MFDVCLLNGLHRLRASSDACLSVRGVGPPGWMQLCWFRFNPETLEVETCIVLDNAERHHVVDGYYATAHWVERNGTVFLGVLTHKRADASPAPGDGDVRGPDLMRFEFLWDEVK